MQAACIDSGMTKSDSVASGTVGQWTENQINYAGINAVGCWPTVLDMTVSLYRYCACDDREKGLTALFMKFSQSHFVTLLYCK